MRKLGLALVMTAAILAPQGARGQQGVDAFLQPAPKGPPESGVSIGLSVGYAIPMGNATGNQSLGDVFSGALPLQVDLGWRFTPNVYLGGFFQYSFGFAASPLTSGCTGNGWDSCTPSDMQFGVGFVYTFLPYATFAPYVGIGLGWEIATVSYSGSGRSLSESLSGFQFARILAGGDFRIGSAFRLGPFVNFSLGQYSSLSSGTLQDKALHMWLQFGLKGTVDL